MKPGILFALMFIFTTCSVSGGIIEIKSGFISGTVAADNDKMTQKSLTSGQLHSIEQWLQEHRSGWKGMLTEAGINEHHVLTFSFRNTEGGTTILSITKSSDGKPYLFYKGPRRWSYSSWGIFKSWAAIRELNPDEFNSFEDITKFQ